jgi:OOP family OmpA-OmpF porin
VDVTKTLIILFVVISLEIPISNAEQSSYWIDDYGNYVRDQFGHCVRTIDWPNGTPVPECGDQVTVPGPQTEKSEQTKFEPKETVPIKRTIYAVGGYFAAGSSTLSPEAEYEIRSLARALKASGVERVVVSGWADPTGSEIYNQRLSEERAKAVLAILIAEGINPELIETLGMGECKLAAVDQTLARVLCRRVDLVVTSYVPYDKKTRFFCPLKMSADDIKKKLRTSISGQ